jgi:hypothetical protein
MPENSITRDARKLLAFGSDRTHELHQFLHRHGAHPAPFEQG